MATSFFGGAFFSGEFFNTPVTPASTGPGPAGRSSGSSREKRRRKIIIGDRLYEVDSLSDVEFLLKRVVREETGPITRAATARVRVVDRVTTKLGEAPAIAVPVPSATVDWSGLWAQLAVQNRDYADALLRVLERQEEDDIETLLLLH